MASQKCTWCNRSGIPGTERLPLQVCGGCKLVRYCSRKCQKSDWPYHKLVCKQYGEFMTSTPRPSKLHKLAFLFPTDVETPELHWINFKQYPGGPDSWEDPDVKPYLGPINEYGNLHTKRYDVSRELKLVNPTLQEHDLDHTVAICFREEWAEDGSELNACIDKMMKGNQPIKWRGPMLAFSLTGTARDPPFFEDFIPGDIRVVAQFLGWYGGPGSNVAETSSVVQVPDSLLHQFSNLGMN